MQQESEFESPTRKLRLSRISLSDDEEAPETDAAAVLEALKKDPKLLEALGKVVRATTPAGGPRKRSHPAAAMSTPSGSGQSSRGGAGGGEAQRPAAESIVNRIMRSSLTNRAPQKSARGSLVSAGSAVSTDAERALKFAREVPRAPSGPPQRRPAAGSLTAGAARQIARLHDEIKAASLDAINREDLRRGLRRDLEEQTRESVERLATIKAEALLLRPDPAPAGHAGEPHRHLCDRCGSVGLEMLVTEPGVRRAGAHEDVMVHLLCDVADLAARANEMHLAMQQSVIARSRQAEELAAERAAADQLRRAAARAAAGHREAHRGGGGGGFLHSLGFGGAGPAAPAKKGATSRP
eukprot:tig00020604_g11849.t1